MPKIQMITVIIFIGLMPYNQHYSTDVLDYWWIDVSKVFLALSCKSPGKWSWEPELKQ